MKKLITILSLIFIHLSSWSQKAIHTNAPCNDAMLQKIPGRWVKDLDVLYDNKSKNKQEEAEVIKRVDAIHEILFSVYPSPVGVDAAWHRSIGSGLFAKTVKFYVKDEDRVDFNIISGITMSQYVYTCGFFPYFCNVKNNNEIYQGFPGETGTSVDIYANDLRRIEGRSDTMTVAGHPVYELPVVKERKNGYEILYDPGGGSWRAILLHRKGMLPYIPVTRKQYLDYCLSYVQNHFDKQIALNKQAQPDKELLKIQLDQAEKDRARFLQRYRDELKKATENGSMDSPALVYSIQPMLYFNDKIFLTEQEGGRMLVTENPDYFKNDLPKYVPQFFVLEWAWNDWPPQANIRTIMETKFPLEKLQAMMDK
jgi:hypothetical protein